MNWFLIFFYFSLPFRLQIIVMRYQTYFLLRRQTLKKLRRMKKRWQYRKIAIRIALKSHLMQTKIITIKAPQKKECSSQSSNKTLNFELSRGKNWIMTPKKLFFPICGVISNVWTHYFWINKVWINMLPIIWCHFSYEKTFSWRKLFFMCRSTVSHK